VSAWDFRDSFVCRVAGHKSYRLTVTPHDARCRPLTPILVTMCGRCGKELARVSVNRSARVREITAFGRTERECERR